MRNPTVCAAIFALLLGAGTASAHHAFSADFDQNKPVTLEGTITKVQWTSPHVMTYIDVKDNDGKERLAAGKAITDEALLKMDYYVEGVQGKLPAAK